MIHDFTIDFEALADSEWAIGVYDVVDIGHIEYRGPNISPSVLFQCPHCRRWSYWNQLYYVLVRCTDEVEYCDHDGVVCLYCNEITDLWIDDYDELGYLLGYLDWDWVV